MITRPIGFSVVQSVRTRFEVNTENILRFHSSDSVSVFHWTVNIGWRLPWMRLPFLFVNRFVVSEDIRVIEWTWNCASASMPTAARTEDAFAKDRLSIRRSDEKYSGSVPRWRSMNKTTTSGGDCFCTSNTARLFVGMLQLPDTMRQMRWIRPSFFVCLVGARCAAGSRLLSCVWGT